MGSWCEPEVKEVPQTTTVVQGSEIPEWMSQGGQELFNMAKQLANKPYQSYSGIPRVAPLTALQQQGMDLASNMAGKFEPMVTQATQGFDQAAAEKYMNPYQSQVMDNITRRMNEQFEQQRQRMNVGAGSSFGSERYHTVANPALANQQATALGDTLGQLGHAGYQAAQNQFNVDQNRLLQGAGALSTLGAQDVGTLMSAAQPGAMKQQQIADTAFQDFMDQRQHPYQQLNFALGALRGVPYSQQSTQTTTGNQYIPGQSPISQAAGLGMAGAGIGRWLWG